MKRVRALAGLAALILAWGCEKLPEIPNVPPTALFVYSPVSPIFAGATTVTFNASGSRDSDGRIASYTWDFGDGTPQERNEGPTVTHVFPDTPATCQETVYTVFLTVSDDSSDIATASQQVRVVELPLPTSLECRDLLEQ